MKSLPKIVVLDGHTLNPGDLDWQPIREQGDFHCHPRTSPDEVVARAAGAAIVLTNKAVIHREHLDQLPDLRYIGVLATGYNIVDVAAAAERNIPVTNVPGYGSSAVAQHVFALLLALARRVAEHAQSVNDGAWSEHVDFCYWNFPLVDLRDQVLGLVGYGTIGRHVAEIGRAFGMKIIASSSRPRKDEDGVEFVSTDEIFRQADVISLHCSLNKETHELVNVARFASMKPTAFLINTARGGLIQEQALADALLHGQLAGAGLDVLSTEPPRLDNPLLRARNCLITPHIAWATQAARRRLMTIAADNLRGFLHGSPVNVVNSLS